jgi:hypothetical protein
MTEETPFGLRPLPVAAAQPIQLPAVVSEDGPTAEDVAFVERYERVDASLEKDLGSISKAVPEIARVAEASQDSKMVDALANLTNALVAGRRTQMDMAVRARQVRADYERVARQRRQGDGEEEQPREVHNHVHQHVHVETTAEMTARRKREREAAQTVDVEPQGT